MSDVIAVINLNALVTKLRMISERAVGTILGILRKQIIITILVSFSCNIQIAVLVVSAVVAVLAVLAIYQIHVPSGHTVHQFLPLSKERLIKIILLSVFKRVPLITPPIIRMKNLERHSFRIK